MKETLERPMHDADSLVEKRQDIPKNLERDAILRSYRTLYQLGSWQSSDKDNHFLKLFKKAFRFVLQVNLDPSPSLGSNMLFHIIEIAVITAEKFRIGPKSIACALLYELFRAKKISELTLRQEFGAEITSVVKGLTKVSGITAMDSARESSKLRYVLTRFSPANCLVVLIKFAEYLHKMYVIDQFDSGKQMQIVAEAHDVYIPLAHQLGLANVYLELEDLYLKFKHRVVYDTVLKRLRAHKTAPAGFLDRFLHPLIEVLERKKIRYVIKGRTKSIASICHKIKERNIPFESINDFYAVRIIFDSLVEEEYNNCWFIYESITKLYEPKIGNLRDWVSYPKESGYEALHITVMSSEGQWVEVQIRAKRMDEKAEYGDAAHWKYKNNGLGSAFENMDKKWLEKARKFLTCFMDDKNKHISINVNKIYLSS